MALIKCSECGKDISSEALSCPNCGKPVNPSATPVIQITTNPTSPLKVEPELTSKRWKKVKLWSWAAILFGLILMSQSGGSFNSFNVQFGIGFCFTGYGVIVLIIGKIGAWYSDKRTR